MVTMDAIWPQSLKYFLFGSLQKKSVDPQTKTKDKRQQQHVVNTKGLQLEKMSTDLGKPGMLWEYGMNNQVGWSENSPSIVALLVGNSSISVARSCITGEHTHWPPPVGQCTVISLSM